MDGVGWLEVAPGEGGSLAVQRYVYDERGSADTCQRQRVYALNDADQMDERQPRGR